MTELETLKKDIGAEIAKAREKKGQSVHDVAESTRINPDYLTQIESGRLDFLPRPYVVAYLKTYAARVGLNGDALAQKWFDGERAYEEALAYATQASKGKKPAVPVAEKHVVSTAKRPAVLPVTNAQAPTQRYFKEIGIALAMVIIMAALLYVFYSGGRKNAGRPVSNTAAQKEVTHEIPLEEMLIDSAEQESPQVLQPEAASLASQPKALLELSLFASENVWIKVVMDDEQESEFTFRANNSYTWQAEDNFIVRIGNAAAARLKLDNKDLGKLGESGEVVTLRISKDGIQSRRVLRPRPPAPDANLSSPTIEGRADSTRQDGEN